MFSNLLRLKTITYAKKLVHRTPKKLKHSVFRRQFNSLRNRRLEELEKDAVNDKMNPSTQLRFLKELNRNNPHDVVKIIESGEMQVVDEQITAEYVKALAKTGRMTQSNTNKVVDFLKTL